MGKLLRCTESPEHAKCQTSSNENHHNRIHRNTITPMTIQLSTLRKKIINRASIQEGVKNVIWPGNIGPDKLTIHDKVIIQSTQARY